MYNVHVFLQLLHVHVHVCLTRIAVVGSGRQSEEHEKEPNQRSEDKHLYRESVACVGEVNRL